MRREAFEAEDNYLSREHDVSNLAEFATH